MFQLKKFSELITEMRMKDIPSASAGIRKKDSVIGEKFSELGCCGFMKCW